MKEKNESWLLSPHAAYHLELSIDFLHTRPVMDIGANEIPAELLQTWIAPGPKELLIRMADGSAGPNETMPYEVFARAHERHDRSYAEMLEREFHTVPGDSANRRATPRKADRGSPVRRVQLRQLPDHHTGRQGVCVETRHSVRMK